MTDISAYKSPSKYSKKNLYQNDNSDDAEAHLNVPNRKALEKLKGSKKSKNRKKKNDQEITISVSSKNDYSNKKVKT